MRFAVTVLQPFSEASTPLEVDAQPTTLVGDLTSALEDELGAPSRGSLYVGGSIINPALTLIEAGLAAGSAVGLDRPSSAETTYRGLVEVRIVGGSDAGVTYHLPAGHYDIGSATHSIIYINSTGVSATLTVRTSGDVTVTALSAGAELADTILALGEETAWRPGTLLAMGGLLFDVAPRTVRLASLNAADEGLGQDFNRPPRTRHVAPALKFRLPRRPGQPPRAAIPVLPLVLLPVVGALLTVLITGNWRFILFGLLSPVAALVSRSGNRKAQLLEHDRRVSEYEEMAERIQKDIVQAVEDEERILRSAHPDPAALHAIASTPTDRLWERRRSDVDFLVLRAGTGRIPSSLVVEDTNEDEHRRDISPALTEVPVTIDVPASGVVGVAGTADPARWLIAEAAVLHSPNDLELYVLTAGQNESANNWDWTRWLPHVRRGDHLGRFNLGTTADSTARRIAELLQLVEVRKTDAETRPSTSSEDPRILVILDGARRLRFLPGIVTLLREGPGVGIFFICLDREEERLPEECTVVLSTNHDSTALLTTGDGLKREVRIDAPRHAWYDAVARSLAPLREVGDSDSAVLPSAVRLVDLLGLQEKTMADEVAGRWLIAPRSTKARMGVGLDGTFVIDLERDGPHGLVAGTTGSGKSELLQTLVASLAVANRPDEINFVLVDYKGGSAFAECADLPHTVGMVTDLDTHLVERALTSLNAELRRREHILADIGAKDLPDYLDRRVLDPSLAPLPRLVIVIDEFASMVRELPDFVSGLVNLAQRGRSLGLHLILATQRPSGAVSADIRANTTLRIALRTTDASESRDIIDAPDSASLSPSTPGRAYARMSASVLLPFQAARVGGRRATSTPQETDLNNAVAVARLEWAQLGEGLPKLVPSRTIPDRREHEPEPHPDMINTPDASNSPTTDLTTDMAALAASLTQAATKLSISPSPRPWLPPLPDRVMLPLHTAPRTQTADQQPDPRLATATWGLIDNPQLQQQLPLTFDLDTMGHFHLIGAPQTGRSQALRTLTAALAMAISTRDLHIYGIDCGTGALNALAHLPHVGAIIDHRSPERLGRLLARLTQELQTRQRLLGARGAADLRELRSQVPEDQRPAHLVVLVDRLEVFDRDYSTYDNGSYLDRLTTLLRDGAAVGIHLILAGDRTLGSGRYAGTTEDKLVLKLNDAGDWSMVSIRPKAIPEHMPPGRALRPKDGAEVQISVLPTTPGSDETGGAAQTVALENLAADLQQRDLRVPPALRPRPLLALPDRIPHAEAFERASNYLAQNRTFIGLGGDDLVPLGPDLTDTSTFLIAGPPKSGRSTALLTMTLWALSRGDGAVVIAPRRSPLRELTNHPNVASVLTDPETTSTHLREALSSIPQERGLLIIDDAEMILTNDFGPDIQALARGAAGEGWSVLVAGNADALGNAVGGWIAYLRRNRQGLLLSPQSMVDGELIGLRLSRGIIGAQTVPGRGMLHLGDGQLIALQVPEAPTSTTAPLPPTPPDSAFQAPREDR